jgi:hypothetical protein
MSQVTIYIDDDTEQRTRAAARAAGVSVSRWIAGVLRSRVGAAWPADVAALAGSWRPQDDGPACDAAGGSDLARESL